MNTKLSVAVCGNYIKELLSVIKSEKILDVMPVVMTDTCEKCIYNNVKSNNEYHSDIKLVESSDREKNRDTGLVLCQMQIASSDMLHYFFKKGYYVISPGWLKNWRKYVFDDWGFDEENGKVFLQESAKKIVLLNTGIYEQIEEELKLFAKFAEIEYEIIDVGIDYFRNNFLQLYRKWKIEHLENDMKKKSLHISNLSLVYELLPQISLVTTVKQVIEQEFNIFQLLTAASKMAFLPAESSFGSEIIYFKNIEYNTELKDKDMAVIVNDVEPTETGKGFIIKISLDSTLLGYMEVENIMFKEHMSSYIDISVFIGKIFALALLNASHFELLTQSKMQAESASRAKSIFLANMSHELRTPLNAILGYCQLMIRSSIIIKEDMDKIKIIKNSGEHLLNLINEVLEASKVEAGHAIINSNNFDIYEVIRDIELMFREKTDSKNIKFEILGMENLPQYIIIDEIKLKMVLINLIGNAIKFTEQGYVKLKLKADSIGNNELKVTVEVEDTGYGISKEDAKKLFNYFAQTESGIKSNSGTGLGLAISREYIKLMGGEIEYIPRHENGSIFKFYIKVAIGSREAEQQIFLKDIKSIKIDKDPPKILVVDDNMDNRHLLFTLLKETGFNVEEAENGAEAVKIFERWTPDFIWMDIKMSKMDGIEAAKKIRATVNGKKVKIVALSAHITGQEKEEIIKAGFDEYIYKPYNEVEIFSTMKKYLKIEYCYVDKCKTEIEKENKELDLSVLENKELEEIKTAVKNTDIVKLYKIADEIKDKYSDIAELIQRCAEEFEYDPIKKAISKLN